MSAVAGSVDIGFSNDRFVQSGSVVVVDSTCVIHLDPHILTGNLGIVDVNSCTFLEQVPKNKHRWSLTDITSILLEGVSQHCNLLPSDGIEHLGDHLLRETLLLVVIHNNDLPM